jgi:hypothetical protein
MNNICPNQFTKEEIYTITSALRFYCLFALLSKTFGLDSKEQNEARTLLEKFEKQS